MNNFVIENGVLLQYKGKGLDIIIPDEVTTINPHAIKELKRITLNNNCRKICKYAIGTIAGLKGLNYTVDEVVISKDSKLKIVEEYAFPKTLIPISLPDGIKVLNASRASLKYIPPKTRHIKMHAIANHNDILYLPESVLKIDGFGLGNKNVFLTKKHTVPNGWALFDHELDKIVFNVLDNRIYEKDGFKYVICSENNEQYSTVVSIPSKPIIIIPEKLGGYYVRAVYFAEKDNYPAIYISEHVSHISNLYNGFVLMGNKFHKNIQSDYDFVYLKEIGNVIDGIKVENIKSNEDYYYVSNANGITLLTYIGKENKEIYVPNEIDGKKVVRIALDAFDSIKKSVDFIKYPESCNIPFYSKVMIDQKRPILFNEKEVFESTIFNRCNQSLVILDYKEINGFKMLHIKDSNEEGYVIVDLASSVKANMIMEPPRKVNGLNVLGISSRLLNGYNMNYEMAKRYYHIYKKLY